MKREKKGAATFAAGFALAVWGVLAVSCGKSVPVLPGYTLVWSDEFDAGAPDKEKWSFTTGGGGYGNNEMQWYSGRPENVRTEGGLLIIEARKEKIAGWPYTSAKLTSRDAWLYGRVEVRARVPEGVGSWPAAWMLPVPEPGKSLNWPECGELDIVEHVGYDPGTVHFTAHTGAFNHKIGTHKSAAVKVPDAQQEFHTYGLDWSSSRVDFLLDGRVVHTFPNSGRGLQEWPFDKPFQLILNLAVGGDWGGREGVDNASLPWKYEIDWVRVYRADN